MDRRDLSLPGKDSVSLAEWQDWRWQYCNRLHTGEHLAALLKQDQGTPDDYQHVIRRYPFCVTPYYLSLINRDDAQDPVARQCIPDLGEMEIFPDCLADPLAEEQHMPVPGLVHRYADRCLVLTTNNCTTNCRHCNRKRRWGIHGRQAGKEDLQEMIAYIARTSSLREVIISGGDPLTLPEGLLDWFLGELHNLPTIEVIRLGSRIPVVMPMRITKRLCRLLRKHRPLWLNTQFNHANEITPDAARACTMLLEAGIPLSNQSVLLNGVNDSTEALRSLFYGLQRIGVRPYYLFQSDAVAGTGHLRTHISRGKEIMETLQKTMSGLCLPRYVLDTPGEEGKLSLI